MTKQTTSDAKFRDPQVSCYAWSPFSFINGISLLIQKFVTTGLSVLMATELVSLVFKFPLISSLTNALNQLLGGPFYDQGFILTMLIVMADVMVLSLKSSLLSIYYIVFVPEMQSTILNWIQAFNKRVVECLRLAEFKLFLGDISFGLTVGNYSLISVSLADVKRISGLQYVASVWFASLSKRQQTKVLTQAMNQVIAQTPAYAFIEEKPRAKLSLFSYMNNMFTKSDNTTVNFTPKDWKFVNRFSELVIKRVSEKAKANNPGLYAVIPDFAFKNTVLFQTTYLGYFQYFGVKNPTYPSASNMKIVSRNDSFYEVAYTVDIFEGKMANKAYTGHDWKPGPNNWIDKMDATSVSNLEFLLDNAYIDSGNLDKRRKGVRRPPRHGATPNDLLAVNLFTSDQLYDMWYDLLVRGFLVHGQLVIASSLYSLSEGGTLDISQYNQGGRSGIYRAIRNLFTTLFLRGSIPDAHIFTQAQFMGTFKNYEAYILTPNTLPCETGFPTVINRNQRLTWVLLTLFIMDQEKTLSRLGVVLPQPANFNKTVSVHPVVSDILSHMGDHISGQGFMSFHHLANKNNLNQRLESLAPNKVSSNSMGCVDQAMGTADQVYSAIYFTLFGALTSLTTSIYDQINNRLVCSFKEEHETELVKWYFTALALLDAVGWHKLSIVNRSAILYCFNFCMDKATNPALALDDRIYYWGYAFCFPLALTNKDYQNPDFYNPNIHASN